MIIQSLTAMHDQLMVNSFTEFTKIYQELPKLFGKFKYFSFGKFGKFINNNGQISSSLPAFTPLC